MPTDVPRGERAAEHLPPMPVLDIRPDVASGGEPFLRVLAEADATAKGGSFILVAPFEPLAFYPVLAARGFQHRLEHADAATWIARFTRLREPVPATSVTQKAMDTHE